MKEETDMKNEALVYSEFIPEKQKTTRKNNFYLIAFCGGFGGMLSILVGFIFFIVHSLMKGDVVFDEVGTILIFLSFPLLFIGGHFMDKATEKRK